MKKIALYIIGTLLGSSMISCKKALIEINTKPDLLLDAAPEYLLAGMTQDMDFGRRDHLTQVYDNALTMMQYVVPDAIASDALGKRYWSESTAANATFQLGYSYYNDYYNGIGRDMHRLISKIDTMSATNQEKYKGVKAIALVLDTYHAWRIGDIYGALPYTQAFQADLYTTPEYDYNWNLYKVFDKQLTEAATLLAASNTSQIALGTKDFFYAGDYTKWLALANSLRIKIAQRYEKRDPAQLTSVLNDIATNFGSKIMASTDDTFAIGHTQSWNNNVDDINVILFNYDASYAFTQQLNTTNDPRIAFMIRQNDMGSNSKQYVLATSTGTDSTITKLNEDPYKLRYVGKYASPASAGNKAYGLNALNRYQTFNIKSVDANGQPTVKTQNLGYLSAIQSRLWVKNGGFGTSNSLSSRDLMHDDEKYTDGSSIKMKSYFITYADVCFMMSEIAQKGSNGLGKSAEQWYRDGIKASFSQYKDMAVATGVPNAADVTLGNFADQIPFQGLPSIYSQAWINNLITPEEGWATWKRTGYPEFTDVRPNDNGKIGTSSIAYLENLWNGNENLNIIRRGALPLSTNLMLQNQQKAVTDQYAKDASYRSVAQDTRGRIWWDVAQ